MHRTTALLACLLCCACGSFPAFEARTVQDLVVPAAGLASLVCTSHNGAIQVTGVADGTEVRIHAELSVRGDTQEQADLRLSQMRVGHRVTGDMLAIEGVADDRFDGGASPGFAFRIEAPTALASRLTSHNGAITVDGLDGAIELESHNGGISVRTSSPRLAAITHNGAIRADLAGDGPVDGSLTTHNGAIDVRIGSGRSAAIEASTSNGRLESWRELGDLRTSAGHLSGVAGSGPGRLVLATHNGGVVIR